jgi:hypothetical protein
MSETWFGVGASAPLPDVRPCRLLTARQTVTPPSIFARPAIPLSKATIRRKGGDGAMSMKLVWTLAVARRRITDQSRGTIKFAASGKIATLLQHPRCFNCHQLNSPRGLVTLAGFLLYCLPGESKATRFQCLSLPSPQSNGLYLLNVTMPLWFAVKAPCRYWEQFVVWMALGLLLYFSYRATKRSRWIRSMRICERSLARCLGSHASARAAVNISKRWRQSIKT